MSSERKKTLADVRIGEDAVVTEVGGDRPVARRLMEMGLLPGTRVRVARIAPLGDPIELRLRSYSLSIRRAEARGVGVADAAGAREARVAAPESARGESEPSERAPTAAGAAAVRP